MDTRTLRAAVVADLVGFVGVGGIAWFLGVSPLTAVVAGLVAGTLFFLLIVAAARRADSMAPASDTATSHHRERGADPGTPRPADDASDGHELDRGDAAGGARGRPEDAGGRAAPDGPTGGPDQPREGRPPTPPAAT